MRKTLWQRFVLDWDFWSIITLLVTVALCCAMMSSATRAAFLVALAILIAEVLFLIKTTRYYNRHVLKPEQAAGTGGLRKVFEDDRHTLLALDPGFSRILDFSEKGIWHGPHVLVTAPRDDGYGGEQRLRINHEIRFGQHATVTIPITLAFRVTGKYDWQAVFDYYGKPTDNTPQPLVLGEIIRTNLQFQLQDKKLEISHAVTQYLRHDIAEPQLYDAILEQLTIPRLPDNFSNARLSVSGTSVSAAKSAEPVCA